MRCILCLHCIVGIRYAERLSGTNMLRLLGAQLLGRVHPACSSETYGSNSYWECYIHHNAFPLSHLTGTCRMGSSTDPAAVVDPELRYGFFIIVILLEQ